MTVPRFWREQPQRYRLVASECPECHRVDFPPRIVCPVCRRESVGRMKPRQLSGRGTILSATAVRQPAPDFERQSPYAIALVELEEGCRLLGQVVEAPLEEVVPGLAVEAIFRRIREDGKAGVIYYGYKFRPMRTAPPPEARARAVKAAPRARRPGAPAKR